jgi:SAM-dependent methyltransferase
MKAIVRTVQEWSRRTKMRDFLAEVPTGSTVLDAGVTAVNEASRDTNYFLTHYSRDPSTYCGLGVENMAPLRARFPKFRIEQYAGGKMPFADREFDFVFSNAVIEHVGSDSDQVLFLAEMLRVARRVYFTTPNRWFPVELHSMQFFRHWNRRHFDTWARKHQAWLKYPDLNLLGRADIISRLHAAGAASWAITANRILGWPMTYSVWTQRS